MILFLILAIAATTLHGLYMDIDLTFLGVLDVIERQTLITKFIAMITLSRPIYTHPHTDYCFIAHSQNS